MKKIRTIIMTVAAFAVLASPFAAVAQPAFAAVNPREQACKGSGGTWDGDSCNAPAGQGGSLTSIVGTIINTLLFVLGAVAVIVIVIAGFRYATSGGDAGKVKAAKDTILYAIIGLVVAILAYAIVNFVLNSIK